ncbi:MULTISPECIES: hypothetical protein [unclassified Legionella]|uniref:hypothetical protein n=1 Tax=unclassified Legionella TaxID=2622702 RepID=UPI00105577AF|nr:MULTISPECIES: hypothetical protein [unclassified Legionella]MDI9818259.1 hypothetical protein [Legionella sp. PL877]
MFELQTRKTGKYINPSIQNLRKALDNYKNGPSLSLRELIAAIKFALPIIGNYVDTYIVKQKMNALAEAKGSFIVWDTRGSRYPHFQFAAHNQKVENNFISWISLQTGKDFLALDIPAQTELMLACRSEIEFTTKLGECLLSNPDFLLDFVLKSSDAFLKIITTRIGFQLEKHQIAKAIAHHCDSMIDNTLSPSKQRVKLIQFLNEKLSETGCSFEKLMADPLAKIEIKKLEKLKFHFHQEAPSKALNTKNISAI